MSTAALLPEAVVVAAALGLLLAPWLLEPRVQPWLPKAAALAALTALGLELWLGGSTATLFGGGWVQDRFSLFAKAALLLGLLALVAAGDWEDTQARQALVPAYLAVFGGMVAASATGLVGLWAGLELAALGAVAAVGAASRIWGRRLLVVSALAAGLVAFGLALLYSAVGASSLSGLRNTFTHEVVTMPLALAMLVLLAGLATRLGLAPFQAASVEAALVAPATAAAVLGSLLVGVTVVVSARLLAGLVGAGPAWTLWLASLSALSMLLGGLRAASAASPRLTLSWLAVGQLGWVTAGLAMDDRRAFAASLFLLGALLLGSAAAPAVAQAAELAGGAAGLGRQDPARAAALALILLSLAGAPPLAGFFGEFTVAVELVRADRGWVLAVGLLGWVLALWAAARDLRTLYLLPPGPEGTRRPAQPQWSWGAVVSLVPGVLTLAYGVFAYPVHSLALQGAAALGLR